MILRAPLKSAFSIARRSRVGGFTLIEMMIVISIMAVLAGITVPVAMKLAAGDRVTDGARQMQALISSVRDRASSANEPRGIRLLQDNNNLSYVRNMVLIRPADPISLGVAELVKDAQRGNMYGIVRFKASPGDPDANTTQSQILNLLRALPGVDQDDPPDGTVDYYVGAIRLGSGGGYYSFKGFPRDNVTPSGTTLSVSPAGLTSGSNPPFVHLDTPLNIPEDGTPVNNPPILQTYQIPRGAVPLEDSDPITLPGGIVIDLGQMPSNLTTSVDPSERRLSRITRDDSVGQFDIMVAPDGRVIGSAARDPQIVLWIRDETDGAIGPNPNFPNTANPQVFRREVMSSSTAKQVLVVIYGRSGFVSIVNAFMQNRAAPDGFFDFNRYYDNIANGFGSGL